MRILAIEKELGKPLEGDTKELLAREARQAWELYQQGIFREIYFIQDRPIAVIIMEAHDADEAKKALASLPLVEGGYIDFDIIPLKPYPGFSRLFKDDAGH